MKGITLETPSIKKINKLRKEFNFDFLWEGKGNDFIKIIQDKDWIFLGIFNKENRNHILNENWIEKELEISLLLEEYKNK